MKDVVKLRLDPRASLDNTEGPMTSKRRLRRRRGLEVHLPLGMNPGMPVSTTELSLTRVLIPCERVPLWHENE